jgi:hypothetical protein
MVASVELLQPGVGRMLRLLPGLTFPTPIVVATVRVDVVLVALVVIGRRSTGRIHPAWIAGGGGLLVVDCAGLPVVTTDAWFRFTNRLAGLGG